MNESPYLLDDSRTGTLISFLYDVVLATTTIAFQLPRLAGNYHKGKTGPESFTSKRLDFLFYVSVFLSFSSANDIKFNLRRSAANDKIFKLFFLHPFLASTIYNNTIKNKFDIG